MSYSFEFTVETKDEAKARVASELDDVVKRQPSHGADRGAVTNAANAFIDLLADDDTKDIRVSVHGSVGWPHTANDPYGENNPPLSAASVGVNAYHVAKATPVAE